MVIKGQVTPKATVLKYYRRPHGYVCYEKTSIYNTYLHPGRVQNRSLGSKLNRNLCSCDDLPLDSVGCIVGTASAVVNYSRLQFPLKLFSTSDNSIAT